MKCGTCAHGTHLRAKSGASLGFVACKFGDPWQYAAGRMACTRNAWKQSSSAPQPPKVARPGTARVSAVATAADAERERRDAT